MINYKMKINLQDAKVLTSDIELVSGDIGAYRFVFEFFDNGQRVDITDCIMVVRAKRADGKIIEGTGEIVNNEAVFVPKNSMYAVPGELYMEIALYTREKKYITTKVITTYVIAGLGDGGAAETDEVSVFVTLLNQVQSRIDEVKRLASEIVPVRGTDYWTEEDKAEMVADVLAALPSAEEVAY